MPIQSGTIPSSINDLFRFVIKGAMINTNPMKIEIDDVIISFCFMIYIQYSQFIFHNTIANYRLCSQNEIR